MKVLVTGATGSVGSYIVEQLLAKDIEVKALSRKEGNLPKGAQVVLGDLDIPETIKAHLHTIDSLFLITQSEQSDEKFIKNKRIIQMAKEANVARIVALIDFEGNPIEDVIKNSGMEWTLLKPVEFMKNALYSGWAESIQKEGIIRTAFPDSLSARIHEADIADVAVRALTEEGHDKRTYDLTGSEALSPRSMVKQISAVTDKYIDLVEITEEQVKQDWKSKGYDNEFIEYFIIGIGKNPPKGAYTVLPTVEQVTGKPARTFTQWVNENKHYFV
ncbi:hydroxylase [Paenibacillus kribbensis]|uniref:Hydroxylase n=1 Tax=Paenibacillus kribbensis TaxID=172713 RepID=A0A222WNW0_9BACL|nr:NAD(P)H-binding protein [Paenibacillus kribbensis]ASR47604.1 hydroxylase [Paenibacillus kribbensis]